MRLKKLVERWSTSITVMTPLTTNQYNEITYNTATTIQGRFVIHDELVQIASGEKILSKAILYTDTELDINTKIGDYLIFTSEPCKNNKNEIEFYRYHLK
jgi:hypothetical protein